MERKNSLQEMELMCHGSRGDILIYISRYPLFNPQAEVMLIERQDVTMFKMYVSRYLLSKEAKAALKKLGNRKMLALCPKETGPKR